MPGSGFRQKAGIVCSMMKCGGLPTAATTHQIALFGGVFTLDLDCDLRRVIGRIETESLGRRAH
jgi:hypothetical protein